MELQRLIRTHQSDDTLHNRAHTRASVTAVVYRVAPTVLSRHGYVSALQDVIRTSQPLRENEPDPHQDIKALLESLGMEIPAEKTV